VADDTAAIQAALDTSAYVHLPVGTYRVSSLRLRSGTTLFGSGAGSVLVQSTTSNLLIIESSSADTFVENVAVQDLQLLGDVVASGFREHTHLLAVNGSRYLKVRRCVFRGFRGDGLLLGGLSGSGDDVPRHNENAQISDCEFDGVNSDNRNAITVIDGNGVLIRHNSFHHCSRPDMPGAVDIEPDAHAFHTVRNIWVIDNVFKQIGGNVGAVSVVLVANQFTKHPTNFRVSNNTIDGCTGSGVVFVHYPVGGVDENVPSHHFEVTGNTILNASRGFGLYGVVGARIEDNDFTDRLGSNIGNASTDTRCRDVRVLKNRFLRCGSEGAIGAAAFTVDDLLVEGNRFEDCGTGGPGSYALDFDAGTSTHVSIKDNTFVSPTGKTLVAVQKEARHVFTPPTNTFSGNVLNGLPSLFQVA
jgi:hypothetical protein